MAAGQADVIQNTAHGGFFRRCAAGALKAAAYRSGGEHADERAVALASVCRKCRERGIQVALDIGGSRLSVKERGQIVVNLVKVLG